MSLKQFLLSSFSKNITKISKQNSSTLCLRLYFGTTFFIARCLSLSKAASKKPHNFITSSSRKIPHTHSGFDKLSHQLYFLNIFCIKIRVLSRTSLMFLWELKNGIISQNLRELCVIETPKPSRKIPPTVASTSSATKSSITRCLSSRRHIISIALKSVHSIEHL